MNFIDLLSHSKDGKIKLGKADGPPFPVTSGIRQGCPLSPLFVSVVDSLIRRITKEIPKVTVRVFADDSGLVLTSFRQQGG
jgi:hypothetical protein